MAQTKKPEEAKASEGKPPELADPADPPAEQPSGDEPAADPGRETFTLDQLAADGQAIAGFPGYVIAGALAEDDRDELTREEVAQACKRWLDTPVKTEEA